MYVGIVVIRGDVFHNLSSIVVPMMDEEGADHVADDPLFLLLLQTALAVVGKDEDAEVTPLKSSFHRRADILIVHSVDHSSQDRFPLLLGKRVVVIHVHLPSDA